MIKQQSIRQHQLSRRRDNRRRVETRIRTAHLVGICGTGMKSLATLLAGRGVRVTGSDAEVGGPMLRRMQQRGLRVHPGHDGRNLPADADLLVYSHAVGTENPERVLAADLGIPQLSYSAMLGRLMQGREGVAVAGTHGKSTTTALVTRILADAGRSPSAVFGAEYCEPERTGAQTGSQSGAFGGGDLFVAEACEYRRSFLDLRPRYAAILGVEPDHFDCYESEEELRSAFEDFAELVSSDGALVINADCPGAMSVVRRANTDVVTISLNPGGDWWATDFRPQIRGQRFRVFRRGEFFGEMSLPTPGRHNAMNALAAIALVDRLGVSAAEIRESLREFPGVRRRYERVGSWRGVTLIDDYAHHPTAVRATLQSAREEFGNRRIWCAFQPHQTSRTRNLMGEFAGSFGDADEVLLAPVFTAREAAGTEAIECSRELARRAAANGARVRSLDSLDRVVATIDDEARPGDVLLTMGAGDVNRVHHEFTRRLHRNHAAR